MISPQRSYLMWKCTAWHGHGNGHKIPKAEKKLFFSVVNFLKS